MLFLEDRLFDFIKRRYSERYCNCTVIDAGLVLAKLAVLYFRANIISIITNLISKKILYWWLLSWHLNDKNQIKSIYPYLKNIKIGHNQIKAVYNIPVQPHYGHIWIVVLKMYFIFWNITIYICSSGAFIYCLKYNYILFTIDSMASFVKLLCLCKAVYNM